MYVSVYMLWLFTGMKEGYISTGIGVTGCSDMLGIELGTEHGSSVRIASALNHWAISFNA